MTDKSEITEFIFRRLNTAFESVPLEVKKENVETIIKKLVSKHITGSEQITNIYAISANFLKMIMDEKQVNPNFILAALVKHTRNYIGLFLIGLAIRKGANPNVYFGQPGYGNIHVLCAASIRTTGGVNDPYFRYIINLLKLMGSNIDYPAYNVKDHDHEEIDVKYVEKIAKAHGDKTLGGLTVKEFIQEQGKVPNEDKNEFLNTISDNYLVHFMLATDNATLFNMFGKSSFVVDIVTNPEHTLVLMFNISVAGAMNVANEITKKTVPASAQLIDAQSVPIYAAALAFDKELFSLMVKKGSAVKYVSINQLIAGYKKYKDERFKFYKNAFYMLLDAVNVGVEIDLYQYDLLSSAADFDELEEIKKAYEQPRWKKLCSIVSPEETGKPRQELKQIAFELNLDYNMSEEQICNKLKQISLINRDDYFSAVVERQEDRMAAELASSEDYLGATSMPSKKQRPRCNPKSMVIRNPYAYGDGRMAFYRDPKDGEVWCFTSDTFSNLIHSKINPYTGDRLPDKFIETMRSQVTILREMGLFDFSHSIKDTLKEYFDRGNRPDNKKTDYAFNTASKCLSLYGVSEERLSSLKTITLEDTILRDISGVKLNFFNMLTPKHQLVTVMRIIYSISKQKDFEATEFYATIARSINGDFGTPQVENSDMREYLNMHG